MGRTSRIKEIEFAKKLILKSKIKAIYTEEVVRSGTSARINSKSGFLGDKALVIIIPKEEEFILE